ncbi:MAG: fluoride efflux transporter CrcB [Chthoniobacterales bacterium]
MLIQTYVAVMAGGAIGSALRMALSLWIADRLDHPFPLGTLVVNVTGCFAIGFFGGLTEPDGPLLVSPVVRQGVMIGVFGGYTTFSSFGLQTMLLANDGQWGWAGMNIVFSVVFCLIAVWLGALAARAIILR